MSMTKTFNKKSCLVISEKCIALKGQYNKIFDLWNFSSIGPSHGPLTRELKYFLFWLGFRQVIRIFLYPPGSQAGSFE